MAQLICQDLCLGYDDNILVSNLNFTVNEGEYLCIIGENGAGKSTLMKTILQLQKPLSGSIRTSDGLEQNQIGYLPQQTQIQRDFPTSVREIVLSGYQAKTGLLGFYSSAQKKKRPWQTLNVWASKTLQTDVTETFPADSSRGYFWPVPCVPQKKCFFLMSP